MATIIDLHKIFTEMKTIKGEYLSTYTIRDYTRDIHAVYMLVQNTQFDGDISILENYTRVIDKINKLTIKHKAHYYVAIMRLLKQLDPVKYKNVIDSHYYPEFIKHKTQITLAIDDNIINKQDSHRYISMLEIKRRFAAYEINDPDGSVRLKPLLYKTLVAFYILNPHWVPRNDLHTLVIAGKRATADTSKNYIVLNYRHRPDHIILNHYKTAGCYGQQIIKISPELKQIIIIYMIAYSHNYSDYLFSKKESGQKNDSSMYGDTSFSTLVSKAMLNVFGAPINIDIIRQIQISAFNASIPSENQRKAFAKVFLHSVDVAKQYIKLNV